MQLRVHSAMAQHATESSSERGPIVRGVTVRAFLIGSLTVILFAILNPWLQFGLQSWWIVGVGSLLAGPVMSLFLLVCINGAVVRVWPGRALTRTELLVIYAMGLASLGFLGHGGLPYMVAYIMYPSYMATPASGYEHTILPYIPAWLSPATVASSYWFWQGLPEGAGVPWRDVFSPMLYWSLFTLLLLAAMFCLSALFSRDWIEDQRLTFPLVDVPLAITGEGAKPTPGTSLLTNRIFWIGFALPALVGSLDFLQRFIPSVPTIPLTEIQLGKPYLGAGLPWSVLGDTYVGLSPDIFGIMCLIPTEVSLSVWLFYLLFKVQLLAWASFGIAEGTSQSSIQPVAFARLAESGAFIALTGVLLYESRVTLKRALWNLLGRSEVTDAYAPLSGRGMIAGFLLANAGMLWIATRAGMSWWALAMLLGLFYPLCIGSSRLVSAGGVMRVGFDNAHSLFRVLGARQLNVSSLLMFEYINGIYMSDPYNLAMPHMMNSLKLVRRERVNGRTFTLLAALATLLVLVVGVPAMLRMIYPGGAAKLGDWPFMMWPRDGFEYIDGTLRTPERPDNSLRLAMGLGAAVMLGLSWLHLNAPWWPVSPIGFLIASTWPTNHYLWADAFLGWLVVVNVRRWGGLQLYRRLRPAFLGCVIGTYLSDAAFGLLRSVDIYRRLAH
ncbi:MAG: DUF6785 family protein [Armatimonadota bacterium]